MKRKLIKYALAVLFGAVLVAIYLLLRNFTGTEPPAERYRMICDAFTIPGMLLILSAALVALANEGSFTGIGYAVKSLFDRLIPGMGLRKQETYGEYYERHYKKIKGYGFLIQVGLAFMVVALIFFVLFYCTYDGT